MYSTGAADGSMRLRVLSRCSHTRMCLYHLNVCILCIFSSEEDRWTERKREYFGRRKLALASYFAMNMGKSCSSSWRAVLAPINVGHAVHARFRCLYRHILHEPCGIINSPIHYLDSTHTNMVREMVFFSFFVCVYGVCIALYSIYACIRVDLGCYGHLLNDRRTSFADDVRIDTLVLNHTKLLHGWI